MINFNGKFDAKGKSYLVDLYNRGYQVIPTVSNMTDINKLPKNDKYVLKPIDSYDGIGQMKLTLDELNKHFKEGYIIQPLINFKSEIQFYFINRKFIYALEFAPSKVPVYPDAKIYNYKQKELLLAQSFANLNDDLIGIQRINFLKTYNDELLLIEIEDSSPYLDLDMLDKKTLNRFFDNYYKMIMETLEK